MVSTLLPLESEHQIPLLNAVTLIIVIVSKFDYILVQLSNKCQHHKSIDKPSYKE
jgi:hypothetical protein